MVESKQQKIKFDCCLLKRGGGRQDTPKSSLMEDLLGLLRIHIKRGVNLAVRDVNTSDPYVVVKMGKQVTNTI